MGSTMPRLVMSRRPSRHHMCPLWDILTTLLARLAMRGLGLRHLRSGRRELQVLVGGGALAHIRGRGRGRGLDLPGLSEWAEGRRGRGIVLSCDELLAERWQNPGLMKNE